MSLLGEMRRRNIFKISLAYAIASWLIFQIGELIVLNYDTPDWIMQGLVLLLILLFPVVVLLSWAYELEPADGFTSNIGEKLNRIVLILVGIGLIFFSVKRSFLESDTPSAVIPEAKNPSKRFWKYFKRTSRNLYKGLFLFKGLFPFAKNPEVFWEYYFLFE